MRQSVRIQIALCVLCVMLLNSRATHAGETWDGGGANNNWTTGANWNTVRGTEFPPPNDGNADIVMAGTMRLTPRVDVDWDINSLTFNSTAGGFSISGDPGVSLGIGEGGITNNDTQLQILLLPIGLDASQTWNAAAGPLSIGNTVAGHPLLTRTLTLDGVNNINIAGAITQAAALIKTGTGTLTFDGGNTNSYTGTTTVSAGTLALGRTSGPNRAIPGNLIIGDAAGGAGADIVRLDAADQITEATNRIVTVNSSGLLNLNGFNDTVANLAINGGSVSGSGSLVVNEALTFSGGGSISGTTLSALASPAVVNDGALNISGGGQLSNTIGRIGSTAGANNMVSVSGMDSGWTNADDLYVGDAAIGRLDILGGGAVNSAGGFVGNQGGSIGTVNVNGSNWTNNGDLHVGNAGTGSLNITAGGDMTSLTGYIGHQTGATGEVTVDGTGSEWTNSGYIYVGHTGNGTLNVTSGGRVSAGGIGVIGDQAGSVGEVTVEGADSVWEGGFVVGQFGRGTLNISNGGSVDGDFGFLGFEAGSVGEVTVDGSHLGSPGLVVGRFGTGTLSITNRGGVQTRVNSALIPTIGEFLDSTGVITVDGALSRWEILNVGLDPIILRVGWGGDGTLEVKNGGVVDIASSVAEVTIGAGGDGTVIVDGAGSRFANFAGRLTMHVRGHGKLNITNGGFVRSYLTHIGFGGEVNVAGAGSKWVGAGVFVGDGGAGTLSISDSGIVEGIVQVNPIGELRGDGKIVGNVQNDGLVSPGAPSGSLTIDGDYTQSTNGELIIELASASSYDQLIITSIENPPPSVASLDDCRLTIELIEGFVPSVGQTFTIVTADDMDGTFGTVAFPTVPNIAFDLIYNLQSVVLTVSSSGIPGDFNGDGAVDAADYVVWRKNDGTQGGYDTWRTNFGASNRGGSLATIPEPASFAILMIGIIVMFSRRRTAVTLNS